VDDKGLARRRHEPDGALEGHTRWQAHRRDPLQRHEFAHRRQGPADARAGLLEHRNCWHWPRDTQLKENAARYRETNGGQIMATLHSLAMNGLGWMASGRSPRA
jgi:hypothetical protein